MELVAAAKLRRAQARIEAMRPYADTMRELIAGVGRAAGSVRGLPLLQQRETTAATLIVPLSGDRGLAGAFNAQVLRRAFALERQLQAENADGAVARRRQEGTVDAGVPAAGARRRVRRLHRRSGVRRRPGDRAPCRRALRRRGGRPRRPRLQHVRLRAHADGDRAGDPPDLGRRARDRRGGAARRRVARRLHLRARARADPRAAPPGVPRDPDLPRAPRVVGVRSRAPA